MKMAQARDQPSPAKAEDPSQEQEGLCASLGRDDSAVSPQQGLSDDDFDFCSCLTTHTPTVSGTPGASATVVLRPEGTDADNSRTGRSLGALHEAP